MKGYTVTAIDINREAIEQGQQRKDGVNYLVADCTEKLPFANGIFDAIVASFVFVNISKRDRELAVREIYRILKPGGYVWINEATTSEEYAGRYALSRPHVDEDCTFFVFKDSQYGKSITTAEELAAAIAADGVARLAHHFTEKELRELFSEYTVVDIQQTFTQSPRTGSRIGMVTIVFRKPLRIDSLEKRDSIRTDP